MRKKDVSMYMISGGIKQRNTHRLYHYERVESFIRDETDEWYFGGRSQIVSD